MTSRERLIAVARGGDADRQPTVGWSGAVDALIVPVEQIHATSKGSADQAVLADIANPFRAAAERGLDLNSLLGSNPAAGNALLDQVVEQVRSRIEKAMASGADGIFYRLHGAEPRYSTPMSYGGHFLEKDRELLSEVSNARFNLLFIVGGPEAYFDFVADLPADAFAAPAESISATALREIRRGTIAGTEGDTDILIVAPRPNLIEFLETQTLAGV